MSFFDEKAVIQQGGMEFDKRRKAQPEEISNQELPPSLQRYIQEKEEEKAKMKKWEEMPKEEQDKLKEQFKGGPTAMRFNQGKKHWSLVDFKSLEPMVDVLEFGAEKYARDNWKKGLNKKEILESMIRHIIELVDNQELDDDSKLHHIGHIQCNSMFYAYFLRHPEKAVPDKEKP